MSRNSLYLNENSLVRKDILSGLFFSKIYYNGSMKIEKEKTS